MQIKLTVAFQDIELLPTAVVGAEPESDNPALLRSATLPRATLPPGTVLPIAVPLRVFSAAPSSHPPFTPPIVPGCRPPNAFTRKRDFSAAEPGHVLLLEYMEQQASWAAAQANASACVQPHGADMASGRVCVACAPPDTAPGSLAAPVLQPPLLNRPGMGAKLVTYYRKRDASDTDHQKLKQGEPPTMFLLVQLAC